MVSIENDEMIELFEKSCGNEFSIRIAKGCKERYSASLSVLAKINEKVSSSVKKNTFLNKTTLDTNSETFEKSSESFKKDNFFDLERLTIRRKETLVFANVTQAERRVLRQTSGMKQPLLN